MLQAYRKSEITFLRAPALERIPGVVHAFSTRRADSDNFTLGSEGPGVGENRGRFLAAVGIPGWPIVRLRQIHSNIVHSVSENQEANAAKEGDAAYTARGGLVLGVVTADCVPILVADSGGRGGGVVHAGWRGTSEGVARKTIDAMAGELNLDPGELVAVMGPHIGVCCMEVGEEVFDWFADPDVFRRQPEWEKPHLKLAEANRRQLLGAGLDPENVTASSLCTKCRPDLFHSYRRDGEPSGRMFSVVGLAAPGGSL